MGLRCLLGHDFADPEIEREREEEGEEMVVTVREVKTCTRCGETQIISENKEVTSIRPAQSDEPDSVETDDAAAGVEQDVGGWGDADAGSSSFDETTAGDDSSFVDDDFEPPQSAEEDDGVILDDDSEEEPAERQPGEWPDSGDVGREPDRMPTLEEVEGQLDADAADGETDANAAAGSEPSPWPEQQGEDEGFAAELHADDEDVDVDFGNKLAPELGDDTTEEGYDAEFIGNASDEAATHDSGSSGGFARTETLSREDAADLQTEYYCPACEMTRAADKSSMRAGDICPECKHGYITERER